MGKGNVRTRPSIYTAETSFPFIAHHNNPFFIATLSFTPRLAITRYTMFHSSTAITHCTIFHLSTTNNPLHYLPPQLPITRYTTNTFPPRDYQLATCVTYMQCLPLYCSLTLLERTVRVDTVSPKFVRASSKGSNVQTGKDSYFTTERLVKIVLIGRVSSYKYGVGAIL